MLPKINKAENSHKVSGRVSEVMDSLLLMTLLHTAYYIWHKLVLYSQYPTATDHIKTH